MTGFSKNPPFICLLLDGISWSTAAGDAAPLASFKSIAAFCDLSAVRRTDHARVAACAKAGDAIANSITAAITCSELP